MSCGGAQIKHFEFGTALLYAATFELLLTVPPDPLNIGAVDNAYSIVRGDYDH